MIIYITAMNETIAIMSQSRSMKTEKFRSLELFFLFGFILNIYYSGRFGNGIVCKILIGN